MSDFGAVVLQPIDYILQNARFARRHPAFIVGQQQVTWAEFEGRTACLAAKFAGVGLRCGDFAALVLGNGLNFVESLVAVWRVGAVPVPIATSLSATAAAAVAQDADARLLIAEQGTLPVARTTAPHCSLRVLLDGAAEGWIDARSLDASRGSPPISAADPAHALCSVMYSSGTTGQPKGIVHTQLARAQMIDMFVAHMKLDAETVAIVSTPLSANGSWCILLPTVGAGGTTVIIPKFDAAEFQRACLQHRPTYALLVPTQVQMLFDHPDFDPRSLASFKSLMVSGSPLSSMLRERLHAAMPGSLIEVYGTSEGVAVATPPRVAAGKERSVGKPMRGYDVRIIDEAGFEVEAGVIGEIVGRGPSMMARYNHRPELTGQATWTSPLGRRFLRTGDLGCMDEDAYVYVTGRKKDMIISGGQNIYPIDIEEILLTHEDVAEAAVIGVEHAKWGESPAAVVVVKPGRSIDAAALRDWINARVAKHQRLIALEIVAALPRNAMGKVLKREIRLAESVT